MIPEAEKQHQRFKIAVGFFCQKILAVVLSSHHCALRGMPAQNVVAIPASAHPLRTRAGQTESLKFIASRRRSPGSFPYGCQFQPSSQPTLGTTEEDCLAMR